MESNREITGRIAGGGWNARPPAERETFLAAIARHRRASWRVTAACAVGVLVLAVLVAALMAPLFYCLVALAFDVVNLFTPAPDVLGRLAAQLDRLTSSSRVSAWAVVRFALVASLPGLAVMGAGAVGLRRIWNRSPLFNGGTVPGRAPDRSVLAEARLADVVEEISIAAGIPVPRVVIVPGGVNAAACGRDEAHVTLLAGEGLVDGAGREQIEGMIADVVGSVVNGDMAIGLRVTTTLSLFGLVARAGSALTDRRAMRTTALLWRALLTPSAPATLALLDMLVGPFGDSTEAAIAGRPGPDRSLRRRDWLLMPLMGPVVIAGFLSGMVSQMFLAPLVALAWRQRKYMADATAVQLTRDPDALGGALAGIADSATAIPPWASHLAVVGGGAASEVFGSSMVPFFPSVGKRVAALRRMGAHVSLQPSRRMPAWLVILFAGLISIIAALMAVVVGLLVIVSAAMSGMFTLFPAAIVHALLRWAAGR